MKNRLRIKATVTQFREWLEFYTNDLYRRGVYPSLQPAIPYEPKFEVGTSDNMAIYMTDDISRSFAIIMVEIVVYDAVSLLVTVIPRDPLRAVTEYAYRLENAIDARFEKMDIDDSPHTPAGEVNLPAVAMSSPSTQLPQDTVVDELKKKCTLAGFSVKETEQIVNRENDIEWAFLLSGIRFYRKGILKRDREEQVLLLIDEYERVETWLDTMRYRCNVTTYVYHRLFSLSGSWPDFEMSYVLKRLKRKKLADTNIERAVLANTRPC